MEKKKDESKGNTKDNNFDQPGAKAKIAPDPMNGSMPEKDTKSGPGAETTKRTGLAEDENATDDAAGER